MKQPFTPLQLRRFFLLYAGVVILVVLFFLLNRSLNPVQPQEKKIFDTSPAPQDAMAPQQPKEPSRLKLLPAQE